MWLKKRSSKEDKKSLQSLRKEERGTIKDFALIEMHSRMSVL